MIETLQTVWTWIYIIGLGSFALVAAIIIPLGFKDLVRLLRELNEEK